jgi:hypothetical protein
MSKIIVSIGTGINEEIEAEGGVNNRSTGTKEKMNKQALA